MAGRIIIMKEHIQASMVNELRYIAIMYHEHQSLRERISMCVNNALKRDMEWKEEHKLS